jgi:hypothetical protein
MSALALLLLGAVATARPALPNDLHTFLRDQAGFSEKDLQAVQQGEIVTRLLDAGDRPEVAIVGVMHLEAYADVFARVYENPENFMNADPVVQFGVFASPPRVSDLHEFSLDSSDLAAIRECRVGDCDIKLPASAIERLGQEVNWQNPESKKQVNEMFKQMLVDYVSAYELGGNAALGQYDDQKYPLRIADEFHELLEESSYILDSLPEVREYLEGVPQVSSPDAVSLVSWSKRQYEKLRPIVCLNHVVWFTVPEGAIRNVMASKQLYASHYFEASLELMAVIDDDEVEETPGMYVVYVNRSSLDALRRSAPPGMKDRMRHGLRDRVDTEMTSVKSRLEALGQQGPSSGEGKP